LPFFQYKGRNQRGESVRGRLEAVSLEAVASQLFNSGVTPIDILPDDVTQDVFSGLRGLRLKLGEDKVQIIDLIFFCRQMYTLLRAGVPIMQALRGLRESAQNPALAQVIVSLSEGLDAGLDITGAMKRHPQVFSSLFVSMVQVGETTGRLPEVFQHLSQYLEREKDTRDRIKQALRYPTMVVGAIILAMVIINVFVIPTFAKVYEGFRAELPWATKILIAVSNFTISYWYVIVAVLVTLIFGFQLYTRTPKGRYRWHKLKLKLPIVGRILFRATLTRFARAFSIALKSGVPLVQGMTVVSRAVDNDFVVERIIQMRDGVERGETITRTAAATALFPTIVLQMFSVGEETGAMDDLMVEVADYYEREIDYDLRNLSSAIEPILIVTIGVMVLILALGVFLPMWDLARAARLT
jgi:MSHA biogenesis protein MshG